MIDTQQIVDAIIASGVGPLQCETGSQLLDVWVTKCLDEDMQREVVAIECGFVMWLDADTCVIGVQDLLTREPYWCKVTNEKYAAVTGNEWKTTGARSEDDWLTEIKEGSQVAIYALALHKAQYYEKSSGKIFVPAVEFPRIRVRAVTKKPPTKIWPLDPKEGLLEFSHRQLDVTKNALLAKAEAIRAMRKQGALPWQIPGIHCTNKFRRTCDYHDKCTKQEFPEGWGTFDLNNPAAKLVLPQITRPLDDPNLVILSASDYASYSECLEAGRQRGLKGNKKEDKALDIGSAFHAGAAALYEMVRDIQQNNLAIS